MSFQDLRLFCFGLGYVAEQTIRELLPHGAQIAGTQRRKTNHAIQWDGSSPLSGEGLDLLSHSNALLVSIPPQEGHDAIIEQMGGWLKANASQFTWVGYLSSTGVYGDHDGAWVDESTPASPHDARTKARADAEFEWMKLFHEHGLPVHVFRLAGIYGPSRNALVQMKKGEGRCIHKEGQYFSRIHVADIVQVLLASIQQPNPGAVYNVCDDEPAATHDVLSYASELSGLPMPECVAYEDADLTPMGASFYAANRRVRNQKIKDELGVTLHYPAYREGLDALAKTGGE